MLGNVGSEKLRFRAWGYAGAWALLWSKARSKAGGWFKESKAYGKPKARALFSRSDLEKVKQKLLVKQR